MAYQQQQVWRSAVLALCATLTLAACGGGSSAGGIDVPLDTPPAAGTPTATPAPTTSPTPIPGDTPTPEPTATDSPTPVPTSTPEPTSQPTGTPTAEPATQPTASPTATPTAEPTPTPTASPPSAHAFDPAATVQVNAAVGLAVPDASDTVVATDAQGNAMVAWIQFDGTRRNVFARRFNAATGAFEEQKLIGLNQNGDAAELRLKASAQGDMVAVWSQATINGMVRDNESDIVASVYTVNTTQWKTTQVTRHAQDSTNVRSTVTSPDAAFEASSNLARFVWVDRTEQVASGSMSYSLKSTDVVLSLNSWHALENVFTSPQKLTSSAVTLLPNGDAMLVASGNAFANSDHIYLFRRNNGFWGLGNTFSNGVSTNLLWNLGDGLVSGLKLAANEAGQVQIVWRHRFTHPSSSGRQTLMTAFLGANTLAWSDPIQVDSASGAGFATKHSNDPSIAMDESGRSVFTWLQDSDGGKKNVHARYFDMNDATFSGQPTLIAQPSVNVSGMALAMDNLGNMFAGWGQITAANTTNTKVLSAFASYFDTAANTWSVPAFIESNDEVHITTGSLNMALTPAGMGMAVWVQAGKVMFNRMQ